MATNTRPNAGNHSGHFVMPVSNTIWYAMVGYERVPAFTESSRALLELALSYLPLVQFGQNKPLFGGPNGISNPCFSHDHAYRTKSTRSACVSRSAPLSVTSTVSLKESPIAEAYM